YGNQRELEYDFVVAPGANPKVIRFRIDGADRITLDKTGNLLLALPHGEVKLNKPFIYQLSENGGRNEIKGAYAINGKEITFKVRGFDARKPLVIDPVLSYSTYLGSGGDDIALGIAVDSQGSAYVTGNTGASTFPTTSGAFKTTSNFGGAFVTKLDPTGSSLVYSTYLTGTSAGGSTVGQAIAVDSAGNAYVTGVTQSSDFPVVNPLKTSGNFSKTTNGAASWNNNNTGLPGDIQAIAVAPNAAQILYAGTPNGPYRSTDGGATWSKLPTTGAPVFPSPMSMAVSPANSAVVYAGFTNGGLFRTVDSGNTWTTLSLPSLGATVFSIVFAPASASTLYVATSSGVFKSIDSGNTWTPLNNFGTQFPPSVRALAIDPVTPATIYAGTSGNGLFKTTNGGTNWSPINNGLSGSEATFVNTIVIDPSNPATVYAGHGAQNFAGLVSKTTNGGGLWSPVTNGLPPISVNVLVMDRTAPSTLYAAVADLGIFKTTNAGGQWTEANVGLWNGKVVALVAHASDPATLFAGASGAHPHDAFVTKLNPSGSGLLFSTYLGGNSLDFGFGIAVDATGNIYVAGQTMSRNFPTTNAIQAAQKEGENCTDGFVSKINPSAPSFVFSTYLGGNRCDTSFAVALDSAAGVYVAGHTTSSNFPVANAFQSLIAETFNGDSFVTKLTTTGSLVYSTYLGGNNTDTARAIAVDSSGQAYVAGSTSSSNFPTLNQIPGLKGTADDAFVTKLNSQGSALIYSSYVGGNGTDFARGIAVDATGAAHVTGFTGSLQFPITAGALRTESVYFKSIDGGAKWSNDNYGLILGVNASINTLAVHPTQPSTIYAGTGSGVFRSINGGRTWSAINNGLNDTRVSVLLIDPQNPSTIYAATDNFGSAVHGVYKSTDGGNSWNFRKNGMGSAQVVSLAIDPVTPNILYASASEPFGQGKNFKTTDGADNWIQVGSAPSSLASLTVDPHTHTTIYAAGGSSNNSLFRSIDSGATWQPIGFSQTGPFGFFIVASPHTPGLLYALVGLGLFKSVDGGDNWTQVAARFGKIVLDPVSATTLYSISTQEGLLKSTDGGATWASLNNGLNQPIALALAIDPLNPSTLHFAGRQMSGDDAFVFKVNPSGNALVYSTLLGGTAAQDSSGFSARAFAIALDSAGNAYVAGSTAAPNFQTTPNSFQPLLRFFTDAFVTRLTMSHIISGHVRDGSNAPVSGAEVILNDGTSITQYVTENDGSYEFSRLREGRNYTVSASKPHFTMAPPSQTFNNLNSNQTLNFTATATNAAFHTISGKITNSGVGLAGVTVTLSGSQSGLRTTDSNGNYSFELAAAGNYTVTPALLGFTFGPINQTFNNLSASQTANFAATRQNFVVTNNQNHGTGSLRDAIVNANATVGTDTITFNIPGPGVKVIALVNELPEITDPIVIDATTQPGYAGSPLIELDGSALLGSTNGLVITAGSSTIRGLAIGGFQNGAAIAIRDCDNNVIQSNRIGVDASGTVARPNSTGIALSVSSNNLIGGTTAAARNVISGNTNIGIELAGGDVSTNLTGSNNVVQGNYIGTNAAGAAAIGNGNYGVSSFIPGATNNQIGGTSPGSANLISGNQIAGIRLNGSGHTVQGNLIGTDVTGTKSIPNVTGIIAGATNAQIGGLTAAARNIISGNT
ncbi:MAG TPA: SBBP repeat-containing protein, partial [Pyrinomonadaceae bacterium]|nr:SBBP repeat-containing protein [Pyrinomonadaceae bacterium]